MRVRTLILYLRVAFGVYGSLTTGQAMIPFIQTIQSLSAHNSSGWFLILVD